jgi:Fe-S-cluster containining protein
MSDRDATEEFLQSLPEIKPGERFTFHCHPRVSCFNACCSDLNLVLTPYDVLRLRQGLGLTSEQFLEMHCKLGAFPDTGYPALHLKMDGGPNKECPFVSPAGCTVYPDRPAACRTYPIGRATRLCREGEDSPSGLVEQYFLVQEPHCLGFQEDQSWTIEEWVADQDLQRYNAWNDRFTGLMALQKRRNEQIQQRQTALVLLALFQLERFQDFVRDVNLFSRLELSQEAQERILTDPETALEFAFDWLELALYGLTERLQPKK